MSLPTAPKDISSHPTKGSVVDPVNKANKDADVDRKVPSFSSHLHLLNSSMFGLIDSFLWRY